MISSTHTQSGPVEAKNWQFVLFSTLLYARRADKNNKTGNQVCNMLIRPLKHHNINMLRTFWPFLLYHENTKAVVPFHSSIARGIHFYRLSRLAIGNPLTLTNIVVGESAILAHHCPPLLTRPKVCIYHLAHCDRRRSRWPTS